MNSLPKVISVFVAAAALVVSSGSIVSASPITSEGATSGGYQYPAASNKLGGLFLELKGKTTKRVIEVSGTARVNRKILANKTLKLILTLPNGTTKTLPNVKTNKFGDYKYTIKSTVFSKTGIHRVKAYYGTNNSVASVTVK